MQHRGDLLDVEHGVAAVPRRSQALPGLAVVVTAVVDKHHHIFHHQPRALELGDALQHAAAGDQDVVDHHHPIAGIEVGNCFQGQEFPSKFGLPCTIGTGNDDDALLSKSAPQTSTASCKTFCQILFPSPCPLATLLLNYPLPVPGPYGAWKITDRGNSPAAK